MNTRKLMRIKAFWQLPNYLWYQAAINLMNMKNKDYICFAEIMKGRKYR